MSQKIIKVGIIGQGRSGRNIHGNMLVSLPNQYKIVAIADSMADRQAQAMKEYGCRAYDTYTQMVEEEQLDLIVNASPSHLHFPITLELLNKGLHVLCEKPLAKTAAEVDQLIEASQQNNALLAVFQQSRYQHAFVQLREVIASGVLGRIVQVDFSLNGFARRWDWQTLQSNNGGTLMNTGPHPLDQALQLYGSEEMPDITCMMDTVNTFGDAEDYVKLLMRKPGQPTIDLEISSCSAYPHELFNVQGSNGGLRGTSDKLTWRYFKPEEAPEQVLVAEPLVNAAGEPAYCREELVWHTEEWTIDPDVGKDPFNHMVKTFYQMLHRHMVDGAELEITAKQVHLQMQVMEECRRQNAHIYKD
ncbi:Gfo/Idh/MocA family protein [Paenibacillus yanchengensis]|uniref:Gfo/Idh/MocA family protein n=1 Tax=Paenibacillus yanchengensis TaxID=2035833 RepID=A0ABW4YJP0_9BACL